MIAAVLLALAAPAAQPALRLIQAEAPAEEIWRIDQLHVPATTPKATLKALGPDHSMDAVIRHLKALGIAYTRAEVGFAPGRMPAKMRETLSRLPEGEPFILPGDDDITINVILSRQIPPDTVRYLPERRRFWKIT